MIQERAGTYKAREFAENTDNSAGDVQTNWWELFSNYRIKRWKMELTKLTETTGITLEEVSDYIGASYSGEIGFFRKLPKARSTYIGIGMAFHLSLSTINRWISKYGGKRKLYIKDVLDDLIWIYLIEANLADKKGTTNWFNLYDVYREEAIDAYNSMWNIDIDEDIDTAALEDNFKYLNKNGDPQNFKDFINKNMDAFKTAYAKPRRMLDKHLNLIIETKNQFSNEPRKTTLNSLRGYLDDSMVNYLSGHSGMVNVLDKTKKNRTAGIKHIPKNRSTHINLCLALGMSIKEIDKYLELMGFAQLDAVNKEEGALINSLTKWERNHPNVIKFKAKHFKNENIEMSAQEELKAVNDMLQLRKTIQI